MLHKIARLLAMTVLAALAVIACAPSDPGDGGGGGGGGDGDLLPGDVESHAPGRSGEVREGPVLLPGSDAPVTIRYEVIDGLAIYQGDIILGEADMLGTQAIVIGNDEPLWPNRTVPYVISSQFSTVRQGNVQTAIDRFDRDTNVILVPRDGEADYVEFRPGDGCSSWVGRKGGLQVITLANGCGIGSIMHEIAHAVGVWHEQSRSDRDDYVEIIEEDIEADKEHNFDQQPGAVDVGPYDYGSIMHYPADAFGLRDEDGNRKTTIRVLQPGVTIGQRNGLSLLDVEAINRLYPLEPMPYVVLVPPAGPLDERDLVSFVADVVDDRDLDLDAYSITWSYLRWDGVPFVFASTERNQPATWSFCDGAYDVTARATSSATGRTAEATTPITVFDAFPRPAACALSIEIVEPDDGAVFVVDQPVTLRAEIGDDHPETDEPVAPVVWRDGGPDGPILRGAPSVLTWTSDKWDVGVHTVHVAYGDAEDVVTFEVVDSTNQPPSSVTIVAPEDDATFSCANPASPAPPQIGCDASAMIIPALGGGQDPEDGTLSGAALAWSYRVVGSGGSYVQIATGILADLRIPYSAIGTRADVEIRLVATDSGGLSRSTVVTLDLIGLLQ
ncbi:MAG: M12 family metallopeptidase [Trueperaceae bacterium]